MMEPSSSSSMHPTALGRILQFFFAELPGYSNPSPEVPGVKIFCARRFWKSNVYGAVVAGIGAAVLFTIVGGILLCQSHSRVGLLWGGGMILFAITAVWALLAGNAVGMYPYAVEVEEGKGFCFYAPFKKFYIRTEEVKRVKWSWLVAGWVVRLRHRRGLLRYFIIHAAWGQQGRDLVQAIGEELVRRAYSISDQ